METFIAILAIVFGILGIIGSVAPALPGPPLSWLGLLILYIWGGGANGRPFLGFLFGTGLKLITAGVMLFYLVVYAF